MSSKTKIIVLHMKEIIYTLVFAALAILLILLLIVMFRPDPKKTAAETSKYIPGVYTCALTVNNTDLEVEVTVDESRINSIRFANLSESVAAMYPLMQPSIEEIAGQILERQSLDDIRYSSDSPHTSQLILDAIGSALKKARAS